MQIWVDADACPQVIKEILFRAAERAQVLTTLVANAPLRTPPSPFIRSVRVAKGFDVAVPFAEAGHADGGAAGTVMSSRRRTVPLGSRRGSRSGDSGQAATGPCLV